ncbi:uncharacterized protein At5g23160 [Lycium barbarum]|uniref:uncharacterized protein At5g23160 n=1 Tax=Lycium barbarum TaxID=112863 RepID=UPI00293EBA64|nr:uncharacterized protein At5g23160 [Lycium barbarum]
MTQMDQDRPKKKKSFRKSYFLGCFGFSIIDKNLSVNKSTSAKKKNKSLFSFSKFVRKHSSIAKTIPVDISEKIDNRSSREIHVVKPEKKGLVKDQSQTNLNEKVINKTKDLKIKDINHRNNKSLDHLLDNVRDYSTCRNEFSRSVSTHNLSNLINSTKDRHEIKLSHSASLPPTKQKKSPVATATEKVNDERSSQQHDQKINNGNFDPIIGMSILMVTLLIMLFWGKACAIICTCAWFYFLPRFRQPENEAIITGKIGVAGGIDLNSEEYKKKVVLEGFLERNHRNGVGFL